MHRWISNCAAVAAIVAASPAAQAGAGALSTVVEPLSTNITYALPGPPPLVTYVGYTVTITNGGGNTINNIRFTAVTSVTDAAEKARFSSAEGAICTATNAEQTAIECTIGQLRAGQSAGPIALFFTAPVKSVNGVADVDGQDAVAFAGVTYYAEGTGGFPQSTPINSTDPWSAAAVALGTDNPLLVKSTVPKAGGTFFTGDAALTRSGDKFTTLVIVPAATTFTTAEISESPFTTGCINFTVCFQSDITVPGSFSPYLTIVLRQDASNILPGTKIGSVLVKYIDSLTSVESIVGDCASGPQPNSNGVPCIVKRVYYKNRSVDGWTPDLDGDFEWTLINLKNGRFLIG